MFLGLFVASVAGCGGSFGGSSRADAASGSSDQRARVRAAIDVLGREVGHPVNVRIDGALVDGKLNAAERVARFVEALAREVAEVNPESPQSCKKNCSAYAALAIAANARSFWSTVRGIELRYDASLSSDRVADFDPRSSVLTVRYRPDGLPGEDDVGAVRRVVFRRSLEPRFAGRPPTTVGPAEIPAYVLSLLDPQSEQEELQNTLALIGIFPRLVDPALSVARERLVNVRTLIGDNTRASYPELERGWAAWYRAYASTLQEDRLRTAAYLVFTRERGDLSGLPAFEHAMTLLALQSQGRGTHESAVLACANPERCHGPLWAYLVDRRRPERREQLAAVLVAAKNPAFVEFVVTRMFEQRDVSETEILGRLSVDAIAWEPAFTAGLLSLNGLYGDIVVDAWTRTPTLRVPLLRSIARVATTKPPGGYVGKSFRDTPVGHASRALDDLSHRVCGAPATRAEFVALATQHIPKDNPVWRNQRPCGGS